MDLALTSTTLEYPDAADFLMKMIGADVPVGWLPPGVVRRVSAVAALGGLERTRAAVQLARELRFGAVPVAPYATGVMGELISTDLDCPEALVPGLGVDLVGCTLP